MKKLLLTLLAAVGILFLLFAVTDGVHVMPGILLIGGIILIFFGAKRKKPTKKEELPALSKEKKLITLKAV